LFKDVTFVIDKKYLVTSIKQGNWFEKIPDEVIDPIDVKIEGNKDLNKFEKVLYGISIKTSYMERTK
jgi:hypothetical protein